MMVGAGRGFLFIGIVLFGFGEVRAATYYIHSDHLSSFSVLTDQTGSLVTDGVLYYPYGAILHSFRSEGQELMPYQYTGQEHDRNSNLFYYNARFYDPELAQFISPDPILSKSAIRLNRYRYTRNNPLVYVDPTGMTEIIFAAYLLGSFQEDQFIPIESNLILESRQGNLFKVNTDFRGEFFTHSQNINIDLNATGKCSGFPEDMGFNVKSRVPGFAFSAFSTRYIDEKDKVIVYLGFEQVDEKAQKPQPIAWNRRYTPREMETLKEIGIGYAEYKIVSVAGIK